MNPRLSFRFWLALLPLMFISISSNAQRLLWSYTNTLPAQFASGMSIQSCVDGSGRCAWLLSMRPSDESERMSRLIWLDKDGSVLVTNDVTSTNLFGRSIVRITRNEVAEQTKMYADGGVILSNTLSRFTVGSQGVVRHQTQIHPGEAIRADWFGAQDRTGFFSSDWSLGSTQFIVRRYSN
jgi:hypothetical protein